MPVRQVGSSASSVDVLKGLTIEDQRRLARIATKRRFRPGAFLYTQGDRAQHFYIVESGRVRIFSKRRPGASRRSPIAVREICSASRHSPRVAAE
jgi:hypothetical protein